MATTRRTYLSRFQNTARAAAPTYRVAAAAVASAALGPTPKRGADLFEGGTYPSTWDEYIGQDMAKAYIKAACMSAKARRSRLEHVLIATGIAGAGKSSIAKLIAREMGVGMVEVQGAISDSEFLRLVSNMKDSDILFWDEIHQAVSGGRAKAEWLLSVMQDGTLIGSNGAKKIPNITIIGATTDAQKLPETILSRFVVKPQMEEYTDIEAMHIADLTAQKIFDGLDLPLPGENNCYDIAQAANRNPRVINALVKILRDCALSGNAAYVDGEYVMDMVYKWSGVAADGLDKLAQDYLVTLAMQFGGRAGERTLAAALGEPTPPRHTEKLLVQRGYVNVAAGGREVTPLGAQRAQDVLTDRGM